MRIRVALLFAILSGTAAADMNDEPLLVSFKADRLEYRRDSSESALAWDALAWFGTTRDRLQLRSEGEYEDSEFEELDTTAVWSRAVAPYWNVNLGWRGDWQPEKRRNWLAAELEGLAPGFVETRLSLLAGSHGRWSARAKFETEWKLTRRLELVPLLEADWYRQADVENGLGKGLTGVEVGLRLKYLIRPNIKPYVGLSWTGLTGDTADLARAASQQVRRTQWVAGLAFWF